MNRDHNRKSMSAEQLGPVSVRHLLEVVQFHSIHFGILHSSGYLHHDRVLSQFVIH